MTDIEDDPTIFDEDRLLRRLPEEWVVLDAGNPRPSSQAFNVSPDGSPMSVVLERDLAETGRRLTSVLEGHPGFGLVAFRVGSARQHGLGVARDPTDEEPAHCVVIGRKTRSARRALAKECEWIAFPAE